MCGIFPLFLYILLLLLLLLLLCSFFPRDDFGTGSKSASSNYFLRSLYLSLTYVLTEPFILLELQNTLNDEFYIV